jgi:GNAT superfamily N-acetyltransferase
MIMEISIRKMTVGDAEIVNTLSHQLGYPLSIEQTIENIKRVTQSKDHIAFVAEFEGHVVGWIGASQAIMIEVMPHCEISGLVIAKDHHGKGIGKLLIEEVKHWARKKGNSKLSLHCNIKRTETHEFYKHLRFTDLKKQTNFVIDL